MNIKVVKTLTDFANLETTWNSLLRNTTNTHINSTFTWNWVWWSIYGKEKKLFILVVSDNNKVIGIAPLCLSKSKSKFDAVFSINRLTFIGSGISDSLDFLIAENNNKVILQLFEYIESNCNCDEIMLMDINQNSENFKQLLKLSKIGQFNVSAKKLYGTYAVNIRKNFNEYFKELSSDQRRSLKKRKRKLKSKYDLTYDISNTIDDKFLNEFKRLEIERSKSIKSYKRNFLLSNRFTCFLKELNNNFPKGRIKIFSIVHDSKLIAYNIIFDYEKKLYAWLTSYDFKFSKYSAGILVQKYALKHAFKNEYKTFDFMRGDESYKNFFNPERTDNYSILLYRQNLKMKFKFILLSRIKKIVKK